MVTLTTLNQLTIHSVGLGSGIIQDLENKSLVSLTLIKGLDNPHSIVHKEANILANECSGHEISCSKELIENKIELVEKASEQVFIFLDRILEEKNEQVMKEAANKLFNEEK